MIHVCKFLATGCGIGYIGKGGGTFAAAAFCIVWYGAGVSDEKSWMAATIILVVAAIGIWCASIVEREWGIDSSRVVIDEIAGMGISLLFLPVTPAYVIAGFVLFRFFDIVKPFFIRKLEALPGGWGVMMDDVLAGIYTNLILHVALYFKIF